MSKENPLGQLAPNTQLDEQSKQNPKLDYSKQAIRKICEDLTKPVDKYDCENTIKITKEYIKSTKGLRKILYSEINTYISSLENETRDTVLPTNTLKLLIYTLETKDATKEKTLRQIIIKIYDHVSLSISQNHVVQIALKSGMEEIASDFNKNLKEIEREYITILGIFASIVLAFVGSITFSTSVLQHIGQASIYRLLFTVITLGFILVNIISRLLLFIAKINDKNIKTLNLEQFNNVCLAVSGMIFLSWIIKNFV